MAIKKGEIYIDDQYDSLVCLHIAQHDDDELVMGPQLLIRRRDFSIYSISTDATWRATNGPVGRLTEERDIIPVDPALTQQAIEEELRGRDAR